MNIERFIQARKELGFSQMELSEGICTQATLSRFEKNKQAPNLKILIKLCNRLGLPIGELFPKVGQHNPESVKIMDRVEFNFITSEYAKAQELLDTIDVERLESLPLTLRYLYLKGFLLVFDGAALTEVLFTFDQVLLESHEDKETIFHLLSYTGIGMAYARDQELEKAEFYFSKVMEKIYYHPTETREDTWRVLNIVFQTGVFYARINELHASNALLEYAISICSDNHVTYYLARAAFQLAENGIEQQQAPARVLELLQDARAYAKINKNTILLAKIAQREHEILNRVKHETQA